MNRLKHIHSILESIGNVTREFNVRGNYPFNQYKLGRPHIDILFILSQKAPIDIKSISERLNVTSGAVTQCIDRLVELDLVYRTENPADGRSRLIHPTDKTLTTIKDFEADYIKDIGSAFMCLGDSELVALDEILNKVKNATCEK